MDAWTWFLKLFLEGFPEWGQRDNASIISDRDKGLVPAAREGLVLASAVEGVVEALLHLDVVAEGEAVALQGRVLAGEVGECPLGAIVESRGVADQNLLGLVMEEGECRSVGPPGSRGVSVKDGPALEVEGGESRLVGLLEGRGVPEQDGPALGVRMEGSRYSAQEQEIVFTL
ncbi:unnamed protein product [Closterium sp. NIES-64]|nr:unnamed protein product [Closterium sp. NIES-64]